ncbi:MAG: fumarylacetoacetate hydrolase family protein [Actinobacteria bacterium]|nr:fumarylacetoacetate hydrolase family protein [Actinomycetota bacterium]
MGAAHRGRRRLAGMRLATARTADGRRRVAVHAGEDGVLVLLDAGIEMVDLLADAAARERAVGKALDRGEALDRESSTVLAPIPAPPSIRDFVAFEGHIANIRGARGGTVPEEWYVAPPFYFANPAGALGPEEDVPAPPGSAELDFELEVAAVIGPPGRNLHPKTAHAHVAGLVLMCDWSARDIQRREQRIPMGPAKSKDFATSFGPHLATMDEFEDRFEGGRVDLALEAWLDGEQVSAGRLGDMHWTIGELVAYASRGTELRTGDVIGFGTCPSGCLLELKALHGADAPAWLGPGSHVRMAGERLGAVSARIVEGDPFVPLRDGEPLPA